jgi:hypothetical protein
VVLVPAQAHPVVPTLVQVHLQAVPAQAPVLQAARAQAPVPAHPQAVQVLAQAQAPVLPLAVQAQAPAQVHPRAVQARALAQVQAPAQAKWLIIHRRKVKINEFLNINYIFYSTFLIFSLE